MGEFHYSRFPHQYWKEEIVKVKSGGINIVATYILWNSPELTFFIEVLETKPVAKVIVFSRQKERK